MIYLSLFALVITVILAVKCDKNTPIVTAFTVSVVFAFLSIWIDDHERMSNAEVYIDNNVVIELSSADLDILEDYEISLFSNSISLDKVLESTSTMSSIEDEILKVIKDLEPYEIRGKYEGYIVEFDGKYSAIYFDVSTNKLDWSWFKDLYFVSKESMIENMSME